MSRFLRQWLLALALVAATAAIYAPVRNHAFLNYDDDIYFTDNPHAALGLSLDGLAWAMTSDYAGNWFPVTWLSILADAELHGLSSSGVHVANVVLHILSTLLLFGWFARSTGAIGRSAFVAAVFALHPLHVESVAWATERKDVLSGLFWMLTLWAYARYAARPGLLRYAGVVLCFVLGLMAKPMLVTLPFVLILLDTWPLGRIRAGAGTRAVGRIVLEKVPLLLISLGACALTLWAQSDGIATLTRISIGTRIANAALAYARYVELASWPRDLAVFYPHPGADVSLAASGAAGVALLGMSTAVLLQWSRRPYLAVGWFWFLGTLIPVIGLVQVGSQALADRYTYIPLVGLSLMVAWAGFAILVRGLKAPRLAALLALGCVVALGAGTIRQVRHWKNSETLFEHALAVTRDNHIAHTHLGLAKLERGAVREGIDHYRVAVEIRPDFLEVVNNLAWILATHPDATFVEPAEALRLAERASVLSGNHNPAVLDTLAAAHAAAGNFSEAVRIGRRAMRLARVGGNPALEDSIRVHLDAYQAGSRYRDPEAPKALPDS